MALRHAARRIAGQIDANGAGTIAARLPVTHSERSEGGQPMPTLPREHPDRRAIMAELHARPVDIIGKTGRVRRAIFIVPPQPGAMDSIFKEFQSFLSGLSGAVPDPETRQFAFMSGGRATTWEFHTEFVTVTWRTAIDDEINWPTDIGLDLFRDADLIGAVRVDVLEGDTIPQSLLPQFELSSLCVVMVESGAAQVVSDFVEDRDGFTRFEFAAGELTPLRRSIVTRRLLEVDTYRTMALLALPLARRISPELRAAETELTRLMEGLPEATSAEAVQRALSALHALSIRSGQLSERTSYRFAAAQAYGDILRARLAGLREVESSLGSTISRYLGNRVDPALATCTATEKRLSVLADKIERAIGLLNVRIGLDMQIQNQALLENLTRTAQSQYRLQATVEGLSVIAISYYLLGILAYVLAGPLEGLAIDKSVALSIAAPFAVLLVWLFVRGIRRRHFD